MIAQGGLLYYFASPNEDRIVGYTSVNATTWRMLPNRGLLSCNFKDQVITSTCTASNDCNYLVFQKVENCIKPVDGYPYFPHEVQTFSFMKRSHL